MAICRGSRCSDAYRRLRRALKQPRSPLATTCRGHTSSTIWPKNWYVKGTASRPTCGSISGYLERLYAATRYPDALGGIDPNRVFVAADAVDAAARAEAVLSFVDSIVASALD